MTLRHRVSRYAGRLSPSQCEDLGRALTRGCGYIGVGPVALLFNLPRRFEKPNPPPVRPISLNEIGMRT